jgi:hypothetical protein
LGDGQADLLYWSAGWSSQALAPAQTTRSKRSRATEDGGGRRRRRMGQGPMKGRQHARPVGMMNGVDVVDLEIFSNFLAAFW